MSSHTERVAFVGPDPLPALATRLDLVCAEYCGLSQEEEPRWDRFAGSGPASTAAVLARAEVHRYLSSGADAVLVWKSSAEVERMAGEIGVVLANSPAQIARRIENKGYFSRGAPAAGLPIPATRTGVAGFNLLGAAEELTPPLIFQLARGFSGEQTYLAKTAGDLEELLQRFRGRACRIAELVLGTPVTVTGVVSPSRLLVGPACLQVTGVPSLTPHPLGSCGNDYSQPVPEAQAVHELALRAADWLRRLGHRGIFGLDLVVGEGGSIWCIEINPRLVASVPLFSLSARGSSRRGILAEHLASFGIGETGDQDLECDWSQVILYQRGARRAHSELATAVGTLAPSGHFQPTGQMGIEGPAKGEVGVIVQSHSRPGKELARLISEGACCAPDGSLLPQLVSCVRELRSLLEESSPDEGVL